MVNKLADSKVEIPDFLQVAVKGVGGYSFGIPQANVPELIDPEENVSEAIDPDSIGVGAGRESLLLDGQFGDSFSNGRLSRKRASHV